MEMEQTNRTILFEKVNGSKQSMISLLGGIEHKESLSDDEVQEVHQYLEVSSFDEFLKKFEPSVFVSLDTEKKQVHIHIGEEFTSGIYEKQIINTENSFFSLLLEKMDKKRKRQFSVSGYEKLLNQLIPNHEREQMLKARKNLISSCVNGDEGQAEHCIREIIHSYDKGMYLLELYLQEVCLYLTDEEIQKNQYMKAVLEKKKDYEIYPIKISKDIAQKKIFLSDSQKKKYETFVSTALEKEQLKHRTLLQYWLTLPSISEENKEQFQKSYQGYMDLYVKLVKDYWYTTKPLMETMLGIREFFRQYGNVENGMSPVMIISNCTAKEINQEKGKRSLQLYLETVNHKNFYYNTIWYAIIPNLQFVEREEKELTRERFQGNGKRKLQQQNQTEDVAVLIGVLQEYAIQSFVSVSIVEESTMDGLMQHGVSLFAASFQGLEDIEHKEYVIPCYPNFIVMREGQAQRSIGYQLGYDDMEESFSCVGRKKVYLSEIGIGAAYIAAGLQAACQCPEYLKKYYKSKVDMQVPGVAYQVENEYMEQRIATEMTVETLRNNTEMLERARYQCKGMLLAPVGGKIVPLTARTFNYNSSNHETISIIQTITYIERKIRYVTQDFKKNLIVQFFQNRPGSIREQWGNSKDCVNGLIKEGEALEYEMDEKNHTCTFKLLLQEEERKKTVFITKK